MDLYRKYYSYNDMPRPAKPVPPPKSEPCEIAKANDCSPKKNSGFLGNLSNDDLILAVVLLILLMDGCEDKLLLAAIGFILLGDI